MTGYRNSDWACARVTSRTIFMTQESDPERIKDMMDKGWIKPDLHALVTAPRLGRQTRP